MDQPEFQLTTYIPIFIYLVVILLFAVGALTAAHLIGPYHKTPVKQMPYESGMDPIGDTYQRFDVKFYLIAILFLVFDVELLFLYPWAVVAYRTDPDVLAPAIVAGLGGSPLAPVMAVSGAVATTTYPAALPASIHRVVFWEILVFLATLVVAYVYAWRKGVFQWR